MRQVILNFHGIGTPKRELEVDEAPYWISPELFEATVSKAVELKGQVETSFTFDDGNLSDLEIAAPILNDAGYSGEVFVLSSRLDTPGSLSRADIKTLQEMGHRIGTHGADHVDWKALDEAGFARELTQARDIISEAAGHPITSAAIPFGRYNRNVVSALRKAGYSHVYSSDGGAWKAGQYPCPRTSLTEDMTVQDVENILLGRESLKISLRRMATMAIKPRI